MWSRGLWVLAPIPAVRKALARAGLTVADMGLIELNEAFAVQSLAVMKELGFRQAITNVNGGAIASRDIPWDAAAPGS